MELKGQHHLARRRFRDPRGNIILRAGSTEDGNHLSPVLHKAVVLVRSCGGDGQVITQDGLVYGQVFAPGDLGSGIVTKPVHAEAPGQVFTPSDLGFGVVPKLAHA